MPDTIHPHIVLASGHAGADDTRYRRVARRISELIDHGTLRPGERIPSVRRLSVQEDVSIATVMQAYRVLEREGLVEARPQSGYYVRPRRWTPPPEPEIAWPEKRVSRVEVSELVMHVIQAVRDPELIRMGSAYPDLSLTPVKELSRIVAGIARRSPASCHAFEGPPGVAALRVQIARRAVDLGCTLSPDDVVTTCGAMEALNLCLRAVAGPGDTIAIESPAFFGFLQAIEALGMRACEVPTYPREGICLDELTDRLDCCRIKACLFTPNFSNPLGSCMPDAKKKALVELLTGRGIPLIEDDVYGDLAFDMERPKPAKAYDRQGMVLSCGSFSKTLAPGYRVGWTAPGKFRERVEFLKVINTCGTTTMQQLAIAEFLSGGGYQRHLRKVRRLYADQMECMSRAVSEFFPSGTRVTRPRGGHLLWVEMPERVDGLELFHRALAVKISVAPGPIFSVKRKFTHFIRLNCGNPWTDKLEQAVRRLGEIACALAESGMNSGSGGGFQPRA